MGMLYRLLQDRAAVNMLKILYDNDGQKTYATRLAEIQQQLPMPALPASAQRLITAGLASADVVEQDAVFSITEKGKNFMQIFDQLIVLANGNSVKKANAMSIHYALTPLEKQMLLSVEKMCTNGKPRVSLHAVAHDLYPLEEPKTQIGVLQRAAQQLAELGMLRHDRIGKNILVGITDQGMRIAKEQH